MICTCRTAAIRIFVRSLTQLHNADTLRTIAATPKLPQGFSHGGSAAQNAVGRILSRPGSYRQLHSTSTYRDASAAAVTVPAPEPGAKESEREHHGGARSEREASDSGAVAELTPEAIDDLAVELERNRRKAERLHKLERTGLSSAAESDKADRASGRTRSPRASTTSSKITGQVRTRAQEEGFAAVAAKKSSKETQKPETEDERLARQEQEQWQIQKEALKAKFKGETWNPRRKLSPDALEGIRALHKQFPDVYTTEVLADRFKVSPEAIRRILKSNWTPTAEEEEERQQRWFARGRKVWERWAALGLKPPKKWRAEGIRTARRKKTWTTRRGGGGPSYSVEGREGRPARRYPIRGVPRRGRRAGDDGRNRDRGLPGDWDGKL